MTQLHAPVQRAEPAIAGWLIEHRIAPDCLVERLRIALLPDLERIEARAQHEDKLVAQHLSASAQLAIIAVALAQQAGLRVGAAVAKTRKHQRDRSKPVKIGHEI